MRERKYLNQEELNRFFEAVRKGSIRDRLMMNLTFHLGLRASELVGLRLDDVQRFNGLPEILVRGVKGGLTKSYLMVQEDVKLLAKWLKERNKIRGAEDNPNLFITARGTLSKMQAQRIFKKYAEEAGIEPCANSKGKPTLGIHQLRFSLGAFMAWNREPTRDIQKRLRHKRLENAQFYTDLLGAEEKEAQERLNKLFKV